MSKELSVIKEFLTQYLDWVEQGARLRESVDAFTRGDGLCGNLGNFLRSTMPYTRQDGTGIQEVSAARRRVHNLLADRLECLYDDVSYPFGGEGEYILDCRDQSHHKCAARLQFCRDWLKELSDVK